jgi:hypothetical protein
MFASAERALELSYPVARERLERALADGGLVGESRRAVGEGLAFVMPVGPRGARFPGVEVVVSVLPARGGPEGVLLPLRWELPGPAGRLVPALDANLHLVPAADGSLLSVVGRYDPPLGRFGRVLDRAGLGNVATATLAALLREIAAHLDAWPG